MYDDDNTPVELSDVALWILLGLILWGGIGLLVLCIHLVVSAP
jgi:preprotein translocase subunit Sss1